jgi:hypothetical protein
MKETQQTQEKQPQRNTVPKSLPIGKLINKAAEKLQLLVRIKAADDSGYVQCVTCGVVRKWNDGIQGGHYISRRKLKHKLLEENIHPQCARCNGPFMGNLAKYTLYMEDMYGRDFVEWLIETQNDGHKYTRDELEGMIADFDEQIKFHKNRIGDA